MKFRDRMFEGLLAVAVVATLANLLLNSAERAVFVDATGRPLGIETRISCPRCAQRLSYILEYPLYECRDCGHRHLADEPPCPRKVPIVVAESGAALRVQAPAR